MRNGGRNGAKYAPQSFLSAFKKLNQDEKTSEYRFVDQEVASQEEEIQDFGNSQIKQSKRIGQALEANPKARILHFGGGHDHIFPLLKALSTNSAHIIVINIDAHADTRTDTEAHSGTPFRQFAKEFQGKFELFQIGLHSFANSISTLVPLEKGAMSVLWREDLRHKLRVDDFFKKIQASVNEGSLVVFSLDADAMDGSQVPGVSAVNANGINFDELNDLWKRYQKLNFKHPTVMGIYELNPVFDSPSMLSMRRMSAFVYETLRS